MFLTLTANLLAEHTFTLPGPLRPGATHRAASASFQLGGKGLNVVKHLHRLGSPALALAALGGPAAPACRAWAAARPERIEFVDTSTPTRQGLVVRPAAEPETTFLGPDQALCPAAYAALAARLAALPPTTTPCLCGSVPGWAEPAAAPLRSALAALAPRLVVDTYGPPLATLAALPCALVKINADECASLLGLPSGQTPSPAQLAAHAAQSPVQAWIITDGPRPALLVQPGRPVTSLTPPPVREVSATGSGDVLLAALLHARHRLGLDLAAALAYALPHAAANAAHPGVAEFPLPLPEHPTPPPFSPLS